MNSRVKWDNLNVKLIVSRTTSKVNVKSSMKQERRKGAVDGSSNINEEWGDNDEK